MLKIGKQLRELRLQKGYSQEYLAHELNMTQGNYCKLESDHHLPSAEALEKIASLYNVSPKELVAGDGLVQHNTNHGNRPGLDVFAISQDPKKLVDDLLAAKEKIIVLQAKHIELLETKLQNLDGH